MISGSNMCDIINVTNQTGKNSSCNVSQKFPYFEQDRLLYLSGLNMMEAILTMNNWLRFPPKPKEAKLNMSVLLCTPEKWCIFHLPPFTYLVDFLTACKKVVTPVHPSWDVGFKKPRRILLRGENWKGRGICVVNCGFKMGVGERERQKSFKCWQRYLGILMEQLTLH